MLRSQDRDSGRTLNVGLIAHMRSAGRVFRVTQKESQVSLNEQWSYITNVGSGNAILFCTLAGQNIKTSLTISEVLQPQNYEDNRI